MALFPPSGTRPLRLEKIENSCVSGVGFSNQVMTQTGKSHESRKSGISTCTRRAGGASDTRRNGRTGPSSGTRGGAGGPGHSDQHNNTIFMVFVKCTCRSARHNPRYRGCPRSNPDKTQCRNETDDEFCATLGCGFSHPWHPKRKRILDIVYSCMVKTEGLLRSGIPKRSTKSLGFTEQDMSGAWNIISDSSTNDFILSSKILSQKVVSYFLSKDAFPQASVLDALAHLVYVLFKTNKCAFGDKCRNSKRSYNRCFAAHRSDELIQGVVSSGKAISIKTDGYVASADADAASIRLDIPKIMQVLDTMTKPELTAEERKACDDAHLAECAAALNDMERSRVRYALRLLSKQREEDMRAKKDRIAKLQTAWHKVAYFLGHLTEERQSHLRDSLEDFRSEIIQEEARLEELHLKHLQTLEELRVARLPDADGYCAIVKKVRKTEEPFEMPKGIQCPDCDFVCASEEALKKHNKKCHKTEDEEKGAEDEPYVVVKAPAKTSRVPVDLTCPSCKKPCQTKKIWKTHTKKCKKKKCLLDDSDSDDEVVLGGAGGAYTRGGAGGPDPSQAFIAGEALLLQTEKEEEEKAASKVITLTLEKHTRAGSGKRGDKPSTTWSLSFEGVPERLIPRLLPLLKKIDGPFSRLNKQLKAIKTKPGKHFGDDMISKCIDVFKSVCKEYTVFFDQK